MRFHGSVLVMCCAMIGLCGCNKGNRPSSPEADGLRAEELVGKWRLIRADGKPPAELKVNSLEIDIAADGTWSSKIDIAGNPWGALKGGGTWSLADGVVNYTNGEKKAESRVSLMAGHLILEPDFHLCKNDETKAPITTEYERRSAPGASEKEDLIAAMKFVKVPRGTFWMGWDSAEKQSRQVEIQQDFELAAYTVMQWQWQELMGNNPSDFSRKGRNSGMVPMLDEADLLRFPVESVSWDNVQDFVKKLNEREKGKGWLYRLPSEAQWEYACRGAATSKEECSFDFYLDRPTNELSSKDANFAQPRPAGSGGIFEALGRNVTVKVGSYAPNKLGLYDMHGNVQQWCDDLTGPKGTKRVARGGSWAWASMGCRAAARMEFKPSSRLNYVGFRVARVASGGE